MERIRGVLQNAINRTGIDGRKLEECRALFLWDEVTPSLITRTQPVSISRGKMFINVTDSVVLHQLTFYKKEYMDKINLIAGKRFVRDIVFRVGKVERRGQEIESRDEYIKRLQNIELKQDEMTRIDEVTAQVEDEDIRNSLRELFISQIQLSKIRGDET